MSLVNEGPQHGRLRRFLRIYHEKRRDQAPHWPTPLRMSRRYAAQIAWEQSRGV